jgi:hypothetical protein
MGWSLLAAEVLLDFSPLPATGRNGHRSPGARDCAVGRRRPPCSAAKVRGKTGPGSARKRERSAVEVEWNIGGKGGGGVTASAGDGRRTLVWTVKQNE